GVGGGAGEGGGGGGNGGGSPASGRAGWVAAAIRRHAARTSSSDRPARVGRPNTVNGSDCRAGFIRGLPGRVYGSRGWPGSAPGARHEEPGPRVPPKERAGSEPPSALLARAATASWLGPPSAWPESPPA